MNIPEFADFLIKNLLKDKRFYTTSNLRIKKILAKGTGVITSSPNNPNGSSIYLNGYLSGDFNHNFECLYEIVTRDKVCLIFTTPGSLYYCENPGKYVTDVNPSYVFSGMSNMISIPQNILIKIKDLQQLPIFSGRTYYLKGPEHFERAIKLKKSIPQENCHPGVGCEILFSTSGSIYVFM